MKKINLSILFLFAAFFVAFAQSPGSFNYQAVVRSASGEIVASSPVSFRISILEDSETGAPVYVETQEATTSALGLVSLKIGQGTLVSGNLLAANWGTAPHFIKIEIDASGGSSFTHLGTSELLSVPYALHAETVSNDLVTDADADPSNELQTMSISGTVLTLSDGGGSVTLPSSGGTTGDNWGTQTVVADATLSGNGTTASPLTVKGDLTDNQTLSISGNELSISEGNSVTLPATGESVWVKSGTKIRYDGPVGIGTDPEYNSPYLQVITAAAIPAIYAANSSPINPPLQVYNAGGGAAAWFRNNIRIADGTEGEGKVLTSDAEGKTSWQTPASSLWSQNGDNLNYISGSVGIGANPPENVLFGSYSSDKYAIVAYNNSSVNSALFAWNKGSGPSAYFMNKLRITDGTEGLGKVLTSDGNGFTSWQTPATGSSSLWTASGDNVYHETGNVGIGTSSPQVKLDIRNSTSTGSIFAESGGWTIHANSSGANSRSIQATSAGGTAVYAEAEKIGIAKLCSTTDGAAGYFSGKVIIQTGNLGIGVTAPSQKLEVAGNIALSSGADRSITLPDGAHSLFVGGIKDQAAAYAVHLVTNSVSGGVPRLTVVSDKVGIGTTSPTQTLDVNGNLRVRSIGSGAYFGAVNRTSDGTLTASSSDIRLKENIVTLENSLEKVLHLRGVNFTWKSNPEYGTRVGFIAQEFEKVIPELVFTNEVDGMKGINYAEVSAVLVEAVKEQQKIIETLRTENERLQANQTQTDKRLEKLENVLSVSAQK